MQMLLGERAFRERAFDWTNIFVVQDDAFNIFFLIQKKKKKTTVVAKMHLCFSLKKKMLVWRPGWRES